MTGDLRLDTVAPDLKGANLRTAIDASPVLGIQLDRPALEELPYRRLIDALAKGPGFRLDFNRLDPADALAKMSDQLFGPSRFAPERAAMAADIITLARTMSSLTDTRPTVALRTYFAPGDLVWHVDRVAEPDAFRLVWPIGRPAGMMLTAPDNIDAETYRGYMRREHVLLGRLDTRVMRAGTPVEKLWAHRPAQLASLQSGQFPFLREPSRIFQVVPGCASIHRVQTPGHKGAFHRSSWANRHVPGIQIVITASSVSA